MNSSPTALVISNLPKEDAESIARQLIESRLAACVTLSPVKSVYRWEGEICIDQEITLTAKVSDEVLERCVQEIKRLHPYELPEILALKIDEDHSYQPYLQWVVEECGEEIT